MAIDAVERMVRRRSENPAYYGNRSWRVSQAFILYALASHCRLLNDEIATLAREELSRQNDGSIETVALLAKRKTGSEQFCDRGLY